MLRIEHLQTETITVDNLSIEPATCLAITGPSGSGKSRFLRALVDIDPNDGTVWLDESERSTMPAPQWRQAIAYVPAESAWWSDRVGDHFASDVDISEGLAKLGLPPDCMDWPVARLSTGEKQRLALLRALAPEPSILALDEPTSALDEGATELVENYLRELLKAGKTLLLVSHDARQADALADTRIRFENGIITERISA